MAENNEGGKPAENQDVESLKNQLKDAQSKLSEQGKKLEEQAKYVQDADQIATLIAANPKLQEDLKKEYDRVYRGVVVDEGEKPSKQPEQKPKEAQPNEMASTEVKELKREIGDIKESTRSDKIKAFEEAAGISGLDAEQKKEMRKEIESYVNSFGQSIKTVPLDRLNDVLDKAYKAVNVEEMVKEGKMEGMAEFYTNQAGSMPGMTGRQLPVETEDEVTPQQAQWAEKFGVPIEKVRETVKSIADEDTRKSAAEIKAEKRARGENL